jgi:arylsulfatase A-like enzyme
MSSQLDLPPTLADLLGLPVPQQFMGRDLFDPGPGRALGRERDLVRFRDAKAPEEFLLCDDRGLPRSLDTPLARWYRWRLGNL